MIAAGADPEPAPADRRGMHNEVSQSQERVLDLRGLRCPQPVLRAKKALRSLDVGAALVMECTDPLTVIDVPAFVNQTGHRLAEQSRREELYVFRIIKQR